MANLRYVIVSDLHFGAESSVLTSLVQTGEGPEGFTADSGTPSAVVETLVTALRSLVGAQTRPPSLILAGDILDLGLSPTADACAAFRGFAELAFKSGAAVFDPVVYYLPGNHDHHLWEAAREDQYVAYLCSARADEPFRAPTHVTGLEPDQERPLVTSAWLGGLINRAPGVSGAEVRVAYPNMVLRTATAPRTVVVSHGHFTESIYALMSEIKTILYPDQRAGLPTDVATLEEENFAWIDFLWSTLGQSGQVGSDMGLIYAGRSSASALSPLVARLVKALLTRGKGPSWLHAIEGPVIDWVVHYEMAQHVHTERGTPGVTLTAGGRAGVATYLSGPVRAQLSGEPGALGGDLTFVFGHTHKPFVERWSVPGFPGAVRIVNTGGWVVDTPSADPVQGAVVALVDDDLEVALLQVYRQGATGAQVRLLEPPPGDGPPGPFWNDLSGRIDPGAAPWSELSAACTTLIEQRYRLQQALTGPS